MKTTRAWLDDGEWLYIEKQENKGMQVMSEDDEPVDTGLFDHQGTRIFRVKERIPCGFRKG